MLWRQTASDGWGEWSSKPVELRNRLRNRLLLQHDRRSPNLSVSPQTRRQADNMRFRLIAELRFRHQPPPKDPHVLRRFILLLLVVITQGCAVAPPEPAKISGPVATVSDSSFGGGHDGGSFFYPASVNGVKVPTNALTASLSASAGRGADLRLMRIERRIPAGKVRFKLVGSYAFAMPLQTLFKSASDYAVEGEIDVVLREGGRYRITGALDAYRREVWIEDEEAGQILGEKIVELAKADATFDAKASFTCCNLHYDGDWISDGNWAGLPFVPAGARITVSDYGRHRASVVIDGRPMRIGHDYGREQETKEAFVAKLMVKADPKLRLATFSEPVKAAIGAGKVMVGMTKEQVIMSLGYPRTDRTSSTDSASWTYWTSDNEEYDILWSADQTVKAIEASLKLKRTVVYVP